MLDPGDVVEREGREDRVEAGVADAGQVAVGDDQVHTVRISGAGVHDHVARDVDTDNSQPEPVKEGASIGRPRNRSRAPWPHRGRGPR